MPEVTIQVSDEDWAKLFQLAKSWGYTEDEIAEFIAQRIHLSLK